MIRVVGCVCTSENGCSIGIGVRIGRIWIMVGRGIISWFREVQTGIGTSMHWSKFDFLLFNIPGIPGIVVFGFLGFKIGQGVGFKCWLVCQSKGHRGKDQESLGRI